jgi:hypothetical protein
MNWNERDVELYLKEKQYIDTAIVPLLPVTLGENIKQAASQGEFVNLLTLHLERQFRGRMLLLPSLSYLSETEENKKIILLQEWEAKIKESGFSHIFYITSDSSWREMKDVNLSQLIWLPSIPMEHMDEQYKHSILEDQVKQLINIIVQKWQNNK